MPGQGGARSLPLTPFVPEMAQVLGHGPIPPRLKHSAHPLSHTSVKSQTDDLPGQLVQTLPSKLETSKQREKLRHCLQESSVTLHEDQPPAHLVSLTSSQHQHHSSTNNRCVCVGCTLPSSCHSQKGQCCSFLLGHVRLRLSACQLSNHVSLSHSIPSCLSVLCSVCRAPVQFH